MAGILVGDVECPIQDIVKVFGSPFMSSITMLKWRSFARRLQTPLHVVKKHQLDLQLDKITHFDVIEELLLEWRSRTSKNASLGELLQLIVEHFQWQELIDFLQSRIRKYAETWIELDTYSQDLILNSMIIFQGEDHTLKSFSSKIPIENIQEILQETLDKEMFDRFFQKQVLQLDTYVPMEQVPYYIQRNLTLRRYLNPKIFAFDSEDIFIFEDIQHHQLTNLVQPHSTDVSGNQVNKLSVRFIILEFDDDFVAIAKTTTQPVHRIKYLGNKLVWEGSLGSLRLIRAFLLDDCEELKETTFVAGKLSTFNTRPTLICSSPEMGKSVLLSHLAHEVKNHFPERIVIVLELGNVLSNKTLKDIEVDDDFVKDLLATALSNNKLGKRILLEFLNNVTVCFEVFLDGFDEVSLEVLEKTKEFIKHLLKYKHMRIFITSRPHLRNELEDAVECVSYNLSPFAEEDQTQYLCDFWKSSLDAKNHQRLTEFSKIVLTSLSPINGEVSAVDFAGIPLQCFMLAQVYSNDAKKHSNRNPSLAYELHNATKSLHDLYTHFMEFKLQKCQNPDDKAKLQVFHFNQALGVLFPEDPYSLTMRDSLNAKIKETHLIEEGVLAVGIMEKRNENLQFVHRTFAEYLVSEFVAQNVHSNPMVDKDILSKFIYENILAVRISRKKATVRDFAGQILKSSINTFLQDHQSFKNLAHVLLPNPRVLNLYHKADFRVIIDLWIQQDRTNATVDALLRALINLGWDEAADNLAKSVICGKPELQFPTICMFLNEHLAKLRSKLSNYNKDNFKMNYSSPNPTLSFIHRASTCSAQRYKHLIQLVVKTCSESAKLVNLVHLSHKSGHDFILYATRYNDVEFFEYCCNVVEAANGLKFPNVNFWTNQLNEIKFEHTPLHEAVVQGNYKLVEYLINVYEEKLESMQNVWQVGLFDSYNDSSYVIKNKVKILFLLESINLLNGFIEINFDFPAACNVELFIAFCNIVGHVPNPNNLEHIVTKVLASVSSYSETDVLVNWFLSKNKVELLLTMFDGQRSVVGYVLSRNVLSSKTLERIYQSCPFNLGSILSGTLMYTRGEELVQTIVEFSGDVNLTNSCSQTLLHKAAFLREINIVRYLLSAGADVNIKDSDGYTALHYAFFDNNMPETNIFIHECVQILIENDADINAKTNNEVTVHAWALLQKENVNIEDRTIDLIEMEVHLRKNTQAENSADSQKNSHETNEKPARCNLV